MKRILITGIDGFFGRNLVQTWLDKYELIGIDLPPQLFDEDSQTLAWYQSINHIDLREDPAYYKDVLLGVDTVIHCAAKTRIDPSWAEFADYYTTNITASQQLLKSCQELGIKKFIYFSSSSVYGNNGTDIQSEDSPMFPTSPYAVSKMAAEYALKAQALKGDTELIIVRPFTMYGPFMRTGTYSLVIAKFIKAYINNVPLVLEGTGNQTRDFIHVTDAIAALELIMEYGNHGDVFNIGTGNSVTIKELADVVSPRQIIAPARTGAIGRTCADISKLTNLGYEPKIQVLEWLTDHLREIKLNTLH
jgi:UDP-glucose 4-epimerase